jgi:hypothetical protein
VFESPNGDEKDRIKELFKVERFTKINAKREDGLIVYNTVISTDKTFTADDIHLALENCSFLRSITREDDEF